MCFSIFIESEIVLVCLFSGKKSNKEEDDDEDDDELLHLEDSDTEAPCDDDMGPVLQVKPFLCFFFLI